jgi:hypothetical protein
VMLEPSLIEPLIFSALLLAQRTCGFSMRDFTSSFRTDYGEESNFSFVVVDTSTPDRTKTNY